MTLVYATLRLSDVTDKSNSWFADVTFDLRHVMATAFGRNYQKRDECQFFRGSSKYERKVNMTSFMRYLFCKWPIVFILRWTSEKWSLFLKNVWVNIPALVGLWKDWENLKKNDACVTIETAKKKNAVSSECARGKSSTARKPEVHPKHF